MPPRDVYRPEMTMYCVNCNKEMAWRAPYLICENVDCLEPEWAEVPK
jgi:hypothetical protein